IGTLKNALDRDGMELRFAMNGGMYTVDHGPVGLYIEGGRILHRIDRRTEGKGNFHMQPNGVFGIMEDGSAFVKTTAAMQDMRNVRYATQSGPMLVS
ncbi:MAG TPA: phosphodiester glycosidase family protein, partial [Flavobacteriales bacterium]|nr:phosphodiester glycosidase family protein [Flavobacteriales bacterium]